MRSQDVSIFHLKQVNFYFLILEIKRLVVSICVTFGQTLKSLHLIYGEARNTVISLIIWTKPETSFMKDGEMHLVCLL